QQTVYGLEPNTRYTLSAYVKTTGGATARLGIKEHGGDEARTEQGVTKVDDYRPLALTFTTGPEAKSATVYCWADGDGAAFFDDVRLERVSGDQPSQNP
ncbi:MAG: hypothetical protein M3347_00475, partial [Armatimonadota bacterium]|nr:hypothetical protein [Armatimonadota bacterium]